MISTSTPDPASEKAPRDGVVEFRLRPEDTTVRFRTRHLAGLGAVPGSVRLLAGRLLMEPRTERLVLLEAALDVTSFDSGSRARDRAVLSPKFLDVAAHPTAVFHSTSAERGREGWMVQGTLTVNGITSPVLLLVADLEVATAVEAHATASIDRFDFGITFPTLLASRRLEVTIHARADRTDG